MDLKKAALSTLSYHDIFDYPMTQQEIWRFLVVNSKLKTKNEKLKLKIQNCLKELEVKEKIDNKGGYFFLAGRREIIELRKERKKCSEKKIKIAKKIAKVLAKIPYVKMIAVTGALTMENSSKNDDVDLLIITSTDRLWLTRLLAIFILEILGKRRRPNDKKFKDKICLNMFLDESSLGVVKKKQNLFTAHEVVQIRPVYNRDRTYEKFIEVNNWARRYLPNTIEIKKINIKKLRERTNFDFLEKIAYRLQLRYMSSKRTSEDISPHFAFFHPRDIGKEVLKKYKKRFWQENC